MFIHTLRRLFAALTARGLDNLRERDLADIGLPRTYALPSGGHAPFDVSNDRT